MITHCPVCACAYEASSEEDANAPDRACRRCSDGLPTPARQLAVQFDTTPDVHVEDGLVLVSPASSVDEPASPFWLSRRAALELGARLRAGEVVPVDPLDLIGLEYHACSSGTDTPPTVRRAILSACAEIRQLRAVAADAFAFLERCI